MLFNRAAARTHPISRAVTRRPAIPTQKASSTTTPRRVPIDTPRARRLANSRMFEATAPLSV